MLSYFTHFVVLILMQLVLIKVFKADKYLVFVVIFHFIIAYDIYLIIYSFCYLYVNYITIMISFML